MTAPAGWEGILDTGEKILWQGRPDGKIVFRPANIVTFLFGLFFAGFALFWMIMASAAGGFFWAFGLIHFSVGLGLSFGAIFWGVFVRRHTWYTLTDRRAFIATDIPIGRRSLKSYPITDDTVLDFAPGDPASVWFAEEVRRNKNTSIRKKIGFERITDGEKVYRMFRDIQEQQK